MTVNTKIVSDILRHIGWDSKSDWYVGIASDASTRLFHDHNVDEKNGRWIRCDAQSETDARDTERYLLQNYPFQGGTGGGNYPRYVYAYKITPTTKE